MKQFLASQPDIIFYLLFVIFTTIVFLVAYKLGRFISRYNHTRSIAKIKQEKDRFNRESQNLWSGEKEKIITENKQLQEKIEGYRKKISGLGILSFGGSKKRADILYSLLLENETLEQILHEQLKKLASEQKVNLDQRLLDIGKRQRLLAEIFDSQKIKEYVNEVLKDKNLLLLEKK